MRLPPLRRAAALSSLQSTLCQTPWVAVLALALAVSACTTVDNLGRETMAKDAAEPGGFLETPERLRERRERDPFHGVWYARDFDFETYRRIEIAPVNTEYVRAMNLWEGLSLASPNIEEDVGLLAVELRETFVRTLREDTNRRLGVVDVAGEQGLVLEMALIEVVPNKAWLGALGLASWGSPLIPAGVAGGTLAAFLDRGWVSIEGRLRDGVSGRVVVEIADSEMGKTRIVDLEVVTWYGHAHAIFQDWASQFVQRINRPLDQPVEEAPWFTLDPW